MKRAAQHVFHKINYHGPGRVATWSVLIFTGLLWFGIIAGIDYIMLNL